MNEIAYLRLRAEQEDACALRASHAKARQVHQELAWRYRQRVQAAQAEAGRAAPRADPGVKLAAAAPAALFRVAS